MNIRLRYSVLLVLFLFLPISCENDKEIKTIDPRDEYIGEYQVHYFSSTYGVEDICGYNEVEDDTIINIEYGRTDSTLNVVQREIWLDENAVYDNNYNFCVKFWSDSISIWIKDGGMSCGTVATYRGKKIL